MSGTDKPPRYYSFLLTAWEERSRDAYAPSTWRFGLETIGDAEGKRVFATIDELVQFLREEIERVSDG